LTDIKCALCQQGVLPDDTVVPDGLGVVHVDCRRPRSLTPEEHIFLYVYCWDHAVAECAVCARRFHQEDLGSDPFGSHTFECPNCRTDLTEIIRTHLVACAELPELLRRRVRLARETAQRLLKRTQELSDRSEVLMREAEAGRQGLNETRERARRERARRERDEL
jgi:hypothetical protein